MEPLIQYSNNLLCQFPQENNLYYAHLIIQGYYSQRFLGIFKRKKDKHTSFLDVWTIFDVLMSG